MNFKPKKWQHFRSLASKEFEKLPPTGFVISNEDYVKYKESLHEAQQYPLYYEWHTYSDVEVVYKENELGLDWEIWVHKTGNEAFPMILCYLITKGTRVKVREFLLQDILEVDAIIEQINNVWENF